MLKPPLDSYALRARLLPALLVLAPGVAAIVAWIPIESPTWTLLGSAGALAAASVLLAHLARQTGRRAQEHLFRKWGGPPTTRFLRHRDGHLNPHTKARYHARLAGLVPNLKLPTARSESAKPEAADAAYHSAVDWLRQNTKERPKFAHIHSENVEYGFRRNLWAMKPAGIVISLASLAAGSVGAASALLDRQPVAAEHVVTMILSAPLLAWWLLRIRASWVEEAANTYAERLLAACDNL